MLCYSGRDKFFICVATTVKPATVTGEGPEDYLVPSPGSHDRNDHGGGEVKVYRVRTRKENITDEI